MLYHQNSFAQVKPGIALAQVFPDLPALHEVVRLLPELHLGQFAVIPAVADDAVLRRGSCRSDSSIARCR